MDNTTNNNTNFLKFLKKFKIINYSKALKDNKNKRISKLNYLKFKIKINIGQGIKLEGQRTNE